MTRSHVTTHALDTSTGSPAADLAVRLEARDGSTWVALAAGRTDGDGRIGELGPESLPEGDYRLVFDTGAYDAARGREGFFPEVTIAFRLADPAAHYHVPLLLSPFGYSTYRGS